MTQSTASEPDAPDREALALARRFVIRFVVTVLGLSALVGAIGALFSRQLIALSSSFVETLGGPGILAGFVVADATILPVPHDALTTFGLLGGMPFWTVVAWASVGSIIGSTIGFLIGRTLSHTMFFRHIMERRGREVYWLARRYGAWVLVAGSLGPIMYSLTCWACGALGVGWRPFWFATALRIPRVAIYLWAIQLGWLTVTG